MKRTKEREKQQAEKEKEEGKLGERGGEKD